MLLFTNDITSDIVMLTKWELLKILFGKPLIKPECALIITADQHYLNTHGINYRLKAGDFDHSEKVRNG